VFENKVLRKISRPRKPEVTEDWRKLHNEAPRDMCSPTNIIWTIISRIMKWVGRVARMGDSKKANTVCWWENPREGDHLEDPSIDGRILLKLIFKWDGEDRSDSE
jgi:hypothetical protein